MPNEMTIREKILTDAVTCVCGQREQDYGSPENNFATIAALWNTYTAAAHPGGVFYAGTGPITAKDVPVMMALLKIARIASGGGSGDSYVDLAGYAACAGEIAGLEKDA